MRERERERENDNVFSNRFFGFHFFRMNRVIEIYLSTSCSSDNFLGSENRSVDEAVNEQGKKKKKKKKKKEEEKGKKRLYSVIF